MGHVGMRKLTVVDSATGVAAVPAMTNDRARLLQHAMLSVYYASVARQLTVSGAPSVLVPAAMPPLSLAEALAILDEDPAGGHARLTAAIWLLVRSSPIPRRGDAAASGLPAELLPYLEGRDLEDLAQCRRAARAAATQLGAFLLAFRDGDRRARREFQAWMRRKDAHSFSDAMTGMLRDSIGTGDYAQTHGTVKDEQLLAHISSLELQTGTSIDKFLRDLAAADAFSQFMRGGGEPMTPDGDGSIDVIPVATVVTQDASTLVTTATATTLVRGDFEHMVAATQPSEWSRSSDVVRKSVYVDDPFSLHVPDPQPAPADGQPVLLRELAAMSWGSKEGQESTFSNVLRVTSSVTRRAPAHDPAMAVPAIDIDFQLCRSIESQVLWDRRPGGLELNQGFMKVRPLGQDHWRVTWRKILRFSDRTPGSDEASSGSFDAGQMLNYLAPTAVSWWVETETYSLGDITYRESQGGRA